jgi:hypothetical protein
MGSENINIYTCLLQNTYHAWKGQSNNNYKTRIMHERANQITKSIKYDILKGGPRAAVEPIVCTQKVPS